MDLNTWRLAPATTNAVERKNQECKLSKPQDLKAALIRMYKIDKAVCVRHIVALEQVRISFGDANEAPQQNEQDRKRNERRNKNYPIDKLAQHGPPDKAANLIKPRSPSCEVNTKNKVVQRKRPATTIGNDLVPVCTKKKVLTHEKDSPDYSLMLTKCRVLYSDNTWYEGTVTGVQYDAAGKCKYI